MSAQHTPGPWRAVEWNCHAATTVIAGGVVVAECSGFGRLADESLGDARTLYQPATSEQMAQSEQGACACARCGEPVSGRPDDFVFCDDCNREIDDE